ncbi:hypothetical protein [Streptomyces qinglanensis]|uniref:hypothetical protein n=1 Tax=Streptomyces qinglanensis TaxID=943816 RepID=UPI0037BDEFD6
MTTKTAGTTRELPGWKPDMATATPKAIKAMATKPTRVAALGCTLPLVLGTAACSADSGAADNTLPETQLGRACGGIFDKQMRKEAKKTRVHAGKTDSYREAATYLRQPDAHNLSGWKVLCRLTPLEKDNQTEDLLYLSTGWDIVKPQNGKSTEWRPSTNGGQFSGALTVLCPNPGGKEFKRYHSLKFSLFEDLHLSNNSRAKLLIAAAKKFVPHMQCTNKITYPDPDEVAPR